MKRVMMISIMVMSILAGTWTWTHAYNVQGFFINRGSIDCNTILAGLRNVNKFFAALECVIAPITFSYVCVNPAGNATSANGRVFDEQAVIVGGVTTSDEFTNFTKNGRAQATVIITNEELAAALESSLPDSPCINRQWNVVPNSIEVEILDGQITLFSCNDAGDNPDDPRNTGCTIEDDVGFSCDPPLPGTTQYQCTETCGGDTRIACSQPPAF